MSGRIWDEIHHRALSFHILAHIVPLPFILVFPLFLSLVSRRYIRCALMEKLVSERVARNLEFYIGIQLMITYMAIMQFATWD